jgi:hypothetical protein
MLRQPAEWLWKPETTVKIFDCPRRIDVLDFLRQPVGVGMPQEVAEESVRS